MEVIIEIRHLYDRESCFLPKEVSVVSVASNFIAHWIVKPPSCFTCLPVYIQKTNNTLTRSVHGLEWTSGDIELEDLEANLKQLVMNVTEMYAVGKDCVKYLTKLVGRRVINLLDYPIPPFQTLYKTVKPSYSGCFFHSAVESEPSPCTLFRAGAFREWVHREYDKEFEQELMDSAEINKKYEAGDQELFRLLARFRQKISSSDQNTQPRPSAQGNTFDSRGYDEVDGSNPEKKKVCKEQHPKAKRLGLETYPTQLLDNTQLSLPRKNEHSSTDSSSSGTSSCNSGGVSSRSDSSQYDTPNSYNCQSRQS